MPSHELIASATVCLQWLHVMPFTIKTKSALLSISSTTSLIKNLFSMAYRQIANNNNPDNNDLKDNKHNQLRGLILMNKHMLIKYLWNIYKLLNTKDNSKVEKEVKNEVLSLCSKFPIYNDLTNK